MLAAALPLAVTAGALWPAATAALTARVGITTKGKDPRVVRDAADARQAPRSRWLFLPGPPKPRVAGGCDTTGSVPSIGPGSPWPDPLAPARRVTPPCEDHDAYREGPW